MNRSTAQGKGDPEIEDVIEERYQDFLVEQGFDLKIMKQELNKPLKKIFMGGFRKGMEYILEGIRKESKP